MTARSYCGLSAVWPGWPRWLTAPILPKISSKKLRSLPKGRRAGAARVDGAGQFEAGAVHPLHRACVVEADMQHRLFGRARAREGELLGLARDIIPIALVELAGEGGAPKRPLHRFAIVDPRLDRGDQHRIDDIAAMLANGGAAAGEGRGEADGEKGANAGRAIIGLFSSKAPAADGRTGFT
jgi:hypothetical protein